VRLTIIGCSGSFPGPDSPASCYLVEADDEAGRTWRVLLDLGNGALGPLQRHTRLSDLDGLLVSHLHPDHFMDACGLYVARRYHPEGPMSGPLPVFGPAGIAARLVEAYGAEAAEGIGDTYTVAEWADGRPVTFGPLTVTPRLVVHPVEAYGLRVEHGGRVLTYSGDTDACPALEELAKDADLLLAEASFQEGRDDVRGIHLTGRRAGEAAAAAGARRLVLTHIPPWTDADVVLAEARGTYDGPVEVARPGSVHEV
jgi:ribonuclease BN (tRNA processing enzyme)